MTHNETSLEELMDIMWRHVCFAAEQTGKENHKLVLFQTEADCIECYKRKAGGQWFAALGQNFANDKSEMRDPKDPNDLEHYTFFYYNCAQLTGKYAAKYAMKQSSSPYYITETEFDKALDKVHSLMTKAMEIKRVPIFYNACG